MGNILTIKETVARAKAEGVPVSEYSLRKWVTSGAVPARYAGNRALIDWDNLVRFLRCEDGGDNRPATVADCKIRRIDIA